MTRIQSIEDLRSVYRRPSKIAAEKATDRIDDETLRFLSLCPFAILSTADPDGTVDASPRGGPPGFIIALDDQHVAMPDLGGNNRLDSYENIVRNPHAGLLLMIPGKEETVRINGAAHLSTDPELLASFTKELRTPKAALVVRTDELFGHCAKAFRRSQLWEPESWSALVDAPDLADIFACQNKGVDANDMRQYLEQAYTEELAAD